MSKSKNKKKYEDEWVEELIKVSYSAVDGYERYLLNTLNYNDLAKIMKLLRNVLEENKE